MRKKNLDTVIFQRSNPEPLKGLNDDEIKVRLDRKLINKTELVVGKSTWEIIRTDVLSFFNILLFVLAGLTIFSNLNDNNPETKWYAGLFFMSIITANIIIGLYQDFKAKHLMKKMKLMTASSTKVVRNGKEIEVSPNDILLDDVVHLSSSDQVPSDCVLLSGNASVNESLLTGESVDVIKQYNDMLLAGTYVTSGNCYCRVEHVGKDNYIETISSKAKAFKRNPSHILKSLKRLFRVIGIALITLAVIVIATYAIQGKFNSFEGLINSITPLVGQFVAMIPSGLYLLTSITLATGVVALYKRNANVQDFYSIEMLARADVLCVDKTGTITDGTMYVKELIPLSKLSDKELQDIIANVIDATKDNNSTAEALRNEYRFFNKSNAIKVLPFNSVNKYSGATFVSGNTYLIGAGEYLNLKSKTAILAETEQYTSKGLRVLILAKGKQEIKSEVYNDEVTALAMIVLQDHVKENAKATFKWFNENGVDIKVISGDNALTVSQIASDAGILNAHKYISLDGMTIDQVKEIANDYTVFGRVTPEQKEALVLALKQAKKTVAMTGDGANDMLALKRADCSIAMNSGAQAAKNVSHIVLLNNDFGTMPDIVAEGRRVINNVERTGSLFLTKTFFAFVVSIVFWIISVFTAGKYAYPFSTNNLLVWEMFGFGMSAFFISLEKNSKPIKKGFLSNILKNALPNGALLVLAVFVCYLCFILHDNGILFTSIDEFGFDPANPKVPRTGATALAVMLFTTLSLVILFNTCRPLNKYRGIVLGCSTLASAGCFVYSALVDPKMIGINFDSLSVPNLLVYGVLTLFFGAVLYYIQPVTDAVVTLFKLIFHKSPKDQTKPAKTNKINIDKLLNGGEDDED